MYKFSFLIITLFGLTDCSGISQNQNNINSKIDTTARPIGKTLINKGQDWKDSLIIKYLNNTNNEFIFSAKKSKTPAEWFFDRIERKDSVNYYVYQVGHTFEYKFVNDVWLYIDSISKSIYEYDLPNDSLILWKK